MVYCLPDCSDVGDGSVAAGVQRQRRWFSDPGLLRGTRWDIGCRTAPSDVMLLLQPDYSLGRRYTLAAALQRVSRLYYGCLNFTLSGGV